MKRKVILILLSFILLLPFQVHAGSLGKGTPSTNPGEWFVGPTPSTIDPNKAPIVFVHGYNSSSDTWRVDNDMDELAYQYGYQTAFINLYPDKNMWNNGSLLAQKLGEIYTYFGNKKLVVVSHSKGGVDTQSAIVHYGAYPYVKRVITLGSPHHGTEIANLAYSSWASWLAGLLGSKNDATYSLQTGYMQNFRSQTDTHANVSKVPFYTMAGKKWGSFGSALYFGGLYLSSYGDNDGLVTVNRAKLPTGTVIRVGDWNHTTIKTGSYTFSYIRPYLTASTLQSDWDQDIELYQEERKDAIQTYYRGGEIKGRGSESFYVEEGVQNLYIDWMSNKRDSKITLIDPKGNRYTNFNKAQDESNFFNGAHHYYLNLKDPIQGKWTIVSENSKEAYLLQVGFDSAFNNELQISTLGSGGIQISNTSNVIDLANINVSVSIEFKDMKNLVEKSAKMVNKSAASPINLGIFGEGVYNVTIDITGKTKTGKPFNRTFIDSVYINPNHVIKLLTP